MTHSHVCISLLKWEWGMTHSHTFPWCISMHRSQRRSHLQYLDLQTIRFNSIRDFNCTPDYALQLSDYALQLSDYALQLSDYALQLSDYTLQLYHGTPFFFHENLFEIVGTPVKTCLKVTGTLAKICWNFGSRDYFQSNLLRLWFLWCICTWNRFHIDMHPRNMSDATHMGMSHGRHEIESRHTLAPPLYVQTVRHSRWVTWTSRIGMRHGTHMNESWHTHERVMVHMNESWYTHAWVT